MPRQLAGSLIVWHLLDSLLESLHPLFHNTRQKKMAADEQK